MLSPLAASSATIVAKLMVRVQRETLILPSRMMTSLSESHYPFISRRYAVFANTSDAVEVIPWHTQFDGVSGSRV